MVLEVLYLDKLLPRWIHRLHLESESPMLASPDGYIVSLDLRFPGQGWFYPTVSRNDGTVHSGVWVQVPT
jgi:hypothetical protein